MVGSSLGARGARWRVVAGVALALFVAGCAAILGIDDGIPRDGGGADSGSDVATADADASTDAKGDADAGPVMCDVDAAFGAPTAFSKLNTPVQDAHLRLLPNELTGVFQSNRDGGVGGVDVYTATRISLGDTWTNVTDLVPINTTAADNDPAISGDGLDIYLSHAGDIYRATRPTPTGIFGTPAVVGSVSSAGTDFAPYILPDGSRLYLSSTRNSDAGVSSLFVASVTDAGFSSASPVGGSGLGSGDNRFAAVTADDLVMYFASNRGGTGTQGGFDVFVATRASTSVPFGSPRVVAEVSSTSDEHADWVSADRCRLYLSSNRSGVDWDIYVATKVP